MPVIKVEPQLNNQVPLNIPAPNILIVLPMTTDRVAREVAHKAESPVRVNSVEDAFQTFRPEIDVTIEVGEESDFRVCVQLRSVDDFDPENLQQATGERNDLVDLKRRIDLLHQLKEQWIHPVIKRFWKDPWQRKEILAALETLRTEFESISRIGGKQAVADEAYDFLSKFLPQLDGWKPIEQVINPQGASESLTTLTDLQSLLAENETWEQILKNIQSTIERAEQVRDEVLGRLFDVLRPLESSYRQLHLFFENSLLPDDRQRKPVDVFILNADPAAIRHKKSTTLSAIRHFIRLRNDNFNFRDDIANIVVPGMLPMDVRETLEQEAVSWGALLITDLDDEQSGRRVIDQMRSGQRYEFLRSNDLKAASDVVTAGYLKLRETYPFEKILEDDGGLFVPASIVLAGVLTRAEWAQRDPVDGSFGRQLGKVKGIKEARFECTNLDLEALGFATQVVSLFRDEKGHLCFYYCRPLSEDNQYGIQRFLFVYRVLSFLERMISFDLKQVAGLVLSRDFIEEEIENPIARLLQEQVDRDVIRGYTLFVDKGSVKRIEGTLDIFVEIAAIWPPEIYLLKIATPEFQKYEYALG